MRSGKLTVATACLLAVAGALPGHAATGRALSLNAAAAAAKRGSAGEIERLCGITEVVGYVEDEAARDVILIGRADPSLPALHLDDFAVALRNVWLKYARVEGHTRYYSPPGCSIDPDPEVLRRLGLVGNTMRGDPEAGAESAADEWSRIGRSPQKVRVMGVPFDSRFARVMVEADYYMKRLTNGSVKLDIPGFVSLEEITARSIRKELAEGRELSTPPHTLNRFWFSPGECTYEQDRGAVRLTTCRVKLLTEEEFLTEHGGVAGMGRPSPSAAQFARDFSSHYDQIAAARPIYRELEGLFRFVAVGRLLRESRVSCAGLAHLLQSHKVSTVPVSRQVLGLTNVSRIEETIETSHATVTRSVLLLSCGGVNMDVRPKRVGWATPGPGRRAARTGAGVTHPGPSRTGGSGGAARTGTGLSELRNKVLSARRSTGAVSWDFQLD